MVYPPPRPKIVFDDVASNLRFFRSMTMIFENKLDWADRPSHADARAQRKKERRKNANFRENAHREDDHAGSGVVGYDR